MHYKSKTEPLPPGFVQNIRQELGEEADRFFAAIDGRTPVSILLNPAKSIEVIRDAMQVPWCNEGYYLAERPAYVFDPQFHAGCYYPMEASSMFVAHALREHVPAHTPVCILDMCAAPGGKSVAALNINPQGSLHVSNEVIRSRFHTLDYNLDKWGRSNVLRSCLDPAAIPWDALFDVVIVDAPCSGEGLFRKDPETRSGWSPDQVLHCSARQRRILREAIRLLRPGGILLYSTCTYSEMENMGHVQYLSASEGMLTLPVNIQPSWGVEELKSGGYGYQFYPHRLQGEGFFCAVMQKPPDAEPSETPATSAHKQFSHLSRDTMKMLMSWIDPVVAGDMPVFFKSGEWVHLVHAGINPYPLMHGVRTIHGTAIGQGTGKAFAPAHALALSHALHPEIPQVSLDRDQAISFLRKDPLALSCDREGWHVARYNGHALGWLKQTHAGLKNYLPTKLRIIKQPGDLRAED